MLTTTDEAHTTTHCVALQAPAETLQAPAEAAEWPELRARGRRAARRAQYKFHAERVVQLQNVRTAPPAAAFYFILFFIFILHTVYAQAQSTSSR